MNPSSAAPPAPPLINPLARARFLLSVAQPGQLPADEAAEVAIVGRSNAGKSSALNALCGMKQLARVSKTPGRTQLINLFDIDAVADPGARLVDLPGYGFAQVPLAVKHRWGELVGGFVRGRSNLRGLVIVMDVRHPLTSIDTQMLDWAEACGRACHVLLTKADKLGFGAGKNTWLGVRRQLEARGAGTTVQLFSAHAHTGLDEARHQICSWLGLSTAPRPEPSAPGDATPPDRHGH